MNTVKLTHGQLWALINAATWHAEECDRLADDESLPDALRSAMRDSATVSRQAAATLEEQQS